MDTQLRKEVRDWKPEVEDRLSALEAEVAELRAQQAAVVISPSSGKKGTTESLNADGNA
jgi:ribosomal protein L29